MNEGNQGKQQDDIDGDEVVENFFSQPGGFAAGIDTTEELKEKITNYLKSNIKVDPSTFKNIMQEVFSEYSIEELTQIAEQVANEKENQDSLIAFQQYAIKVQEAELN